MSIFLNVPIKRPYVRLSLGGLLRLCCIPLPEYYFGRWSKFICLLSIISADQVYQTSVSEFSEGRWNEGFEFKVSYHAQLFDTCQVRMDITDFAAVVHWPHKVMLPRSVRLSNTLLLLLA